MQFMKKTRLFLSIPIILVSAGMGLRGAEDGDVDLNNNDNNCPICIDPMDGQLVPEITRLSCGQEAGGHAFHTDCIANIQRRRCPLDNVDLSANDIDAIRSNYRNHNNIPNLQDIIDRRNAIVGLGNLALLTAFFYGAYHLYHDDPYAEKKPTDSHFEHLRRKAWVAYCVMTRIVGILPASVLGVGAYFKHSVQDMAAAHQYEEGKISREQALTIQDTVAKKHWHELRKLSQMTGHCIILLCAAALFTATTEQLIRLPDGRDLPAIFR